MCLNISRCSARAAVPMHEKKERVDLCWADPMCCDEYYLKVQGLFPDVTTDYSVCQHPILRVFFQNSYHSNNNSSHIFIFMAFVCLRQRTKMMYSNFGATGGETFLVSWAYINFYMPWKEEMDPLLSLLNLSICPVILVCCEILDTQPYTTIKPKLMLSLNV